MSKKSISSKDKKKLYIRNFFKQSKAVFSAFNTPEEAKDYNSRTWYITNVRSNNDYTKQELLNPERKNLLLSDDYRKLRSNNKTIFGGYNGLWRVLIHKRKNKTLDFDISVKAGATHRFHPEVIRTSVITKFGTSTYHEWREIVNADIDSLKELVSAISEHLTSVPWSYTCCKSSARLCEAVGVSTYRGTAFLFPSSY